MIKERIKKLQKVLETMNIGAYIIPTSDYHGSEYISSHFEVRKFMSGFTGSAGTLVVTKTSAFLFADGRYYIQAANEIKGSGIKLIKMGLEGEPTLIQLLQKELKKGENVGFDSGLISTSLGRTIDKLVVQPKGGKIIEEDLVDPLWKNRPDYPKGRTYVLDIKYAGETTASKLKRIREKMKEEGCDSHVVASLTDIAWILNMRGDDVECTPVFLSYLIIREDECDLFIDVNKLDKSIQAYLKSNKVNVHSYFEIKEHTSSLTGKVLIDCNNLNYGIFSTIKCEKKEKENPSVYMRSIKNSTEIANIKEAHLKDAVAMCKFMYWLKTNVGKINMTEVSVQDKLYDLRAQATDYKGPSFGTICAYKEHAAMMHYSATKDSDVPLFASDMLLVDSGGHYLQGTTDITRTFVLGKITAEEKRLYTTVLQSVINLANVKFLKGCSGLSLDILARSPLWNMLIDYKCGTGHGVGYLLSVHEGPQGFRWRSIPGLESVVLEEGMVTTDEPGVYLEGKLGIRIEQELLCKEIATNYDGTFMGFECITYVPIDLDGIDKNYLTKEAIEYLNDYHKKVYELVSPYLNRQEQAFLRKYTKAI